MSVDFLKAFYAVLALVFVILGLVMQLVARVVAQRRDEYLPKYAGYVSISSMIVCFGGFVLALDKDPTVFLSTLVGALAGGVLTKLEAVEPSREKQAFRLWKGPKVRKVKALPKP